MAYVDYDINNFCRRCHIRYEKDVLVCPNCGSQVATRAKGARNSRIRPRVA